MTRLVPDPEAIARRRLHALWRAALGDPPCLDAAPAVTVQLLLRCLPEAEPYTPHPAHPGEGRDPGFFRGRGPDPSGRPRRFR